jgi:hypothetical protein
MRALHQCDGESRTEARLLYLLTSTLPRLSFLCTHSLLFHLIHLPTTRMTDETIFIDSDGEEYSDSDREPDSGNPAPIFWLDVPLTTLSDSEDSGVEVITIEDVPTSPAQDATRTHLPTKRGKPVRNEPIRPPNVEEDVYQLGNGDLIKSGDTVELKDSSKREHEGLLSGPFLRIKHIIRNLETDQFSLRGYILFRTKYHGQIFDCKLFHLPINFNMARMFRHVYNIIQGSSTSW